MPLSYCYRGIFYDLTTKNRFNTVFKNMISAGINDLVFPSKHLDMQQ